MNDGLKDRNRDAMIETLAANPRVERVVLFGSRARGTFRTTSDVDLVLFGSGLTLDDLAALSEAMIDLPIAHRVDLVLHQRIENTALLDHIRRDGVEWFVRDGAWAAGESPLRPATPTVSSTLKPGTSCRR